METNPMMVFCRLVKESERKRIQIRGNTVEIREKEGEKKEYSVDGCFGEGVSQFELYKSVGIPTVAQVLKGRNGSIISCGGEGSGKTFTLFGVNEGNCINLKDDQRGLAVRIIDCIFARVGGTALNVSVAQALLCQDDAALDLLSDYSPLNPATKQLSFDTSHVLSALPDTDPFRIWSTVLPTHTIICTPSKDEVLNTISCTASTVTKGDHVTMLRLEWIAEGGTKMVSNLLFVDCSPVYSKSIHNLRDVALALKSGSQHRPSYSRFRLTRLLRSDFSHQSCTCTKIVCHMKDTPFDLDIFDASSILSFTSLAKKIPRTPSFTPMFQPVKPKALPLPECKPQESTIRPQQDAQPHAMFTSYLQLLTKQLREKEEECKAIKNSASHTESTLIALKSENQALLTKLQAIENSSSDQEVDIDDGEGPLLQPFKQPSEMCSVAGSDSCEEEVEVEVVECSPVDEKKKGIRTIEECENKIQQLTKALYGTRQEVKDIGRKLDESERHKQDVISKYISAASRLEENRKWLRKLKRSLQCEKEKNLPALNEGLKFKKAAEEEARRKEKENEELKEMVQSLQLMVGHLSAEYNRRMQTAVMMNTSRDPNSLDVDELLSENTALKDNISSIMRIMESCYSENTHLSHRNSKVSTQLSRANETITVLEQHILRNKSPLSHTDPNAIRSRAGWSTEQYPEQSAIDS